MRNARSERIILACNPARQSKTAAAAGRGIERAYGGISGRRNTQRGLRVLQFLAGCRNPFLPSPIFFVVGHLGGKSLCQLLLRLKEVLFGKKRFACRSALRATSARASA